MNRGLVRLTMLSMAALMMWSSAGAQNPPAAAPAGAPAAATPQNLQVLAKETTPAQVLQVMQAFTAGLGVQCGYCHVQAAAPGGGRRRPRPWRGRGGIRFPQ